MAIEDKWDSKVNVVKTWQGPKGVCECGHVGDGRWSQHAGTPLIIENGHGKCLEGDCACGRFTFKRWTNAFRDALRRAGVQL
jgi:hypothetical protein